jgi:DNA polymerase III subunit epsilon
MGVPVLSDALFMDSVRAVVGGTSIEEFADASALDEQLALF